MEKFSRFRDAGTGIQVRRAACRRAMPMLTHVLLQVFLPPVTVRGAAATAARIQELT